MWNQPLTVGSEKTAAVLGLPRSLQMVRHLVHVEIGVCAGVVAWAVALAVTGDFHAANPLTRDDDVGWAFAGALVAALLAVCLLRAQQRAFRPNAAAARNLTGLQIFFLFPLLPPRPLPLLSVWAPLAIVILIEFSVAPTRVLYFQADPGFFGGTFPIGAAWWLQRDRNPAAARSIWPGTILAGLSGLLVGFLSAALAAAAVNGEFSAAGGPRTFSTAAAVTGWAVYGGVQLLAIVLGVELSRRHVARMASLQSPGADAKRPAVPLSPDGRFWWDGHAWRPLPGALTSVSPDGHFWWDGQAWRPVGVVEPSVRDS